MSQSRNKNENLSNEELKKMFADFNETHRLKVTKPKPSTYNPFQRETKKLANQSNKNENNKVSNTKYSDTDYQINLPASVDSIFRNKSIKVDNLYLLHHRYSLQFRHEKTNEFEKPESFLKAIKLPKLSEIKDPIANKKLPRPKPCEIDEEAASQFELTKRTMNLARACSVREPICFTFKLLDKLAIGVGGESPYDDLLLMTLHPLYGLPYLPATAIKGMLLSYYEQTDKIKEEERNKLFGSKKNASQLIFFDTFPKENDFQIDFDVFTPHYGDYYGGKGKVAPTDDQDTKVITFPCVKNGKNGKKTSFDVYIACRDEKLGQQYSETLYSGLEEAFKYYGLGAKTALGYGLSE